MAIADIFTATLGDNIMKKIATILAILFLAGCASPVTQRMKFDSAASEIEAKKQREIALQSLVDSQLRLSDVSYLLLTKAESMCGNKTKYSFGMSIVNNLFWGEDFKEAATSTYGLSDMLKIKHIAPNSPAAKAGITDGDIPVAINDWPVPAGKDAVKNTFEKMREMTKDGKPLSISLLRGTERISLQVAPEKQCDYPVNLDPQDIINAFADGKQIVVTKGMMRFAKDDIELSLVVAHELAHNTMKHMDSKITNSAIGSIFDLVAAAYGINTQGAFGNLGASAYSQDFEAEADYVGLYIMAVAGLPIDDAPKFWRRMAAEHPGAIKTNHAATHPATTERFLALDATSKEILAKKTNGNSLVPELKKK